MEGIPEDGRGLATGDVRVVLYSANLVELTVAIDRPAFLVTSEVMYPGWEATVNDRPQPLLMTNNAFRGLTLPAGTSRIVMRYCPRSLAASLLVSVVALLVTATAGIRSEWHPWGRDHSDSQNQA